MRNLRKPAGPVTLTCRLFTSDMVLDSLDINVEFEGRNSFSLNYHTDAEAVGKSITDGSL